MKNWAVSISAIHRIRIAERAVQFRHGPPLTLRPRSGAATNFEECLKRSLGEVRL